MLSDSSNSSKYNINEFRKIEDLTISLVSEIMGRGWSVKRLYEIVKEEVLQYQGENEVWEDFYTNILSEEKEFICFFNFESFPSIEVQRQMQKFKLDLLDGNTISSTYLDGLLNSHISPNKKYIRAISHSFDQHSAINTGWIEIIQTMDILRFYGYKAPEVNNTPIVIDPDGRHFIRNVSVSLVSNKRKHKAPETLLETIRDQISNDKIETVNRKIRSLFEFSRISEESLAPQSTFINLWIGLESFVQTKENDGGIENVKMVVSATTSHNYIYSLVKNFLEDCNRCKLVINDKSEDEKQIFNGRMKAYEVLPFLLGDENHELIVKCCDEKNLLLGYRYRQLRFILNDGKKASRMIEKHMNNVTQHIQRLYRVRSSIVHTAEVNNNINLFIKHLSDYIEATMTVVLHRLENHNFTNLEEVFPMVRDSVDSTIEILKSSNELEKESYYNLLLNGAF